MIQFNNVSPTTNGSGGTSSTNSTVTSSLDSFENALSEAVTQTLQQFGINPNSVNISIAPNSDSGSGSEPSAPASNAATPSTTPASADAVMTPFGISIPNASPANTGTQTPTASATPQSAATQAAQSQPAEDTLQSFDDAYWANQPTAVQALRNVDDTAERTELASQLAGQGYTIDVPIMAWGWDPSVVTSLRQSYGYTWVPSALQNPIESAPGINNPGLTPYDPNNPPAGSIAV